MEYIDEKDSTSYAHGHLTREVLTMQNNIPHPTTYVNKELKRQIHANLILLSDTVDTSESVLPLRSSGTLLNLHCHTHARMRAHTQTGCHGRRICYSVVDWATH